MAGAALGCELKVAESARDARQAACDRLEAALIDFQSAGVLYRLLVVYRGRGSTLI